MLSSVVPIARSGATVTRSNAKKPASKASGPHAQRRTRLCRDPGSARARRNRLDADYASFAAEILRIRTKSGAIEPLVFNRAQQHVHAALEAHLKGSNVAALAAP